MFSALRLIHIPIYKFITFHKYTTTSEFACGATIAELSIAGCTNNHSAAVCLR